MNLISFSLTTILRGYYPVPRDLLNRKLPPTAILLYAALLDRATLSRKTGWADEAGRVYVIYPIDNLADTLHVSVSAIKRNLAALERDGLIERQHPAGTMASHIYINIPVDEQPSTPSDSETPRPTGQTRSPSPRRKDKITDDYYHYEEGESL